DGVGDLVLNSENVGQVAIVAFGPHMAAVFAVDELTGDADALAGLAHAPLEQKSYSEFLRRLLHPDRLALVGENGIAGDNAKPGDLGQVSDNVLGEAIREILLLGVAAHVVER